MTTPLKRYLKSNKISQRAFAKKLRISTAYMNALVHGSRRPGGPLAARIESVTGIPFKVLVLGKLRIPGLAAQVPGSPAQIQGDETCTN